MIALLLCHMVMAKLFLPYLNKTEMSEVIVDVVYILNCTGVPCGPAKKLRV